MDVTTKELSDILSLTQRRIQDLENEGVITKIGRNKWDLKECVQSYIEYKIAKRYEHLRTNRSQGAERICGCRDKKADFGRKKGEVVPIFKLEKDLSDIASTLSNRLYNLPNKIKMRVNLSDETQSLINYEIEETLKELKESKIYKQYA